MKDADKKKHMESERWPWNGDHVSAQDLSIGNQILAVASIAKEISGVDEQKSNFPISPFLF